MHARVTRLQSSPDKIDEVRSMIEGKVIPTAKGLAGFVGGYFLADRSTGQVLGITLFDTEAHLRGSAEAAAKLRADAAEATGGTFASVDEYEVIAQA